MYKFLAVICLITALQFTGSTTVSAQQVDSLIALATGSQDTVKIKRLDPRKALLYSAVLPGLGQIYNGKYWKLPFVYGGFAVTVSVVSYYQKIYNEQRSNLFKSLATGQFPAGRTEQNLRYIVDRARRERDYYVIITGVWYLLQAVDAHVDAHLQEFKWNKDLKVSLNPSMEQNVLTGRTTGLTLSFKF
jgi:Family of unknown function (DUF5683)